MGELAKLVKEKRKRLNISQRKIATVLGYKSAQFISNFERGDCNFPTGKLKALGKILKLRNWQISYALIKDYKKEVEKLLK